MPVMMDDILVTVDQVDLTRPTCISLTNATTEVYDFPLWGKFNTEWCSLWRGVGWLHLAAGALGNSVIFYMKEKLIFCAQKFVNI
jgi:hypothetical protein